MYTSKYQIQLANLLHDSRNNNWCSDCHNYNPQWCSTTYNVFICTRCATIHRKVLNREPYSSNIKSITLDRWTNEELHQFINGNTQNIPLTINKIMSTSSDDPYDLEQLVKRKYMDPMVRENDSSGERMYSSTIYPVLTGRMAKDYELSKFSSHIKQIQNKSSTFYSVDNIVEALSLTHGNIFEAMKILRYNKDRDHRSDQPHNHDNDLPPPKLPKRPDNSLRPAVFDGFSGGNTTGNASLPPQPKPAIFDGLNLAPTAMEYNNTGYTNPTQGLSQNNTFGNNTTSNIYGFQKPTQQSAQQTIPIQQFMSAQPTHSDPLVSLHQQQQPLAQEVPFQQQQFVQQAPIQQQQAQFMLQQSQLSGQSALASQQPMFIPNTPNSIHGQPTFPNAQPQQPFYQAPF
ncbi:uncharacterized protein KNAG_0D02130 [Huiozyma naganishii CBS 8797]|uniref:Arf-GAP domain-containing protein n=1 Tax=Huiozyma naganishii (strain ATCC MYA-139 / BCRC 22969 / CBS 8797 / KCTC 17520 / NBRC 10181 / NCYC 3082 / Yp74L-3) TaxID=1071383 RepID=J7RKF5_HUIN7|nr:hypothetical protein KNAG_0D02130 [Kazachstania naganishii CBS 8797]CCK69963.1 hypothetical protein KNAG_0D02130 [Kazachstania naganishii CBS 8797]